MRINRGTESHGLGEAETYKSPPEIAQAAERGLPAYTVLFSNDKLGGGGRLGDILVPTFLEKRRPQRGNSLYARSLQKRAWLMSLSTARGKHSRRTRTRTTTKPTPMLCALATWAALEMEDLFQVKSFIQTAEVLSAGQTKSPRSFSAITSPC